MRRMFLILLCVAAAHCGAAASPTSPSTSEATLTSLVASGGYVVFFRHAARDTSALSNDALLAADRTGECVPGSELTSQGEADSVAIGEAFRRLRNSRRSRAREPDMPYAADGDARLRTPRDDGGTGVA